MASVTGVTGVPFHINVTVVMTTSKTVICRYLGFHNETSQISDQVLLGAKDVSLKGVTYGNLVTRLQERGKLFSPYIIH